VVARLRRGDRAAFAVLYRWYGDAVWRVILARLPDRAAAEDCLRDTFRAALEKLEQFKDEGQSIYWWIRRIAIHKAMDAHRLRKRDRDLVDRVQGQPDHPTTGQPPPRPDRGVEVAETARDVQISLSRMNERYAEVLKLRLIEDRTREECAELLGITLGNLDVLLHRACKAFRKVYPP
jgi:RNA polymerase sigma-70 factor (ECF subfamily)